jgi:hypothetical protein
VAKDCFVRDRVARNRFERDHVLTKGSRCKRSHYKNRVVRNCLVRDHVGRNSFEKDRVLRDHIVNKKLHSKE